MAPNTPPTPPQQSGPPQQPSTVALGVSGSIAAYKALLLVRALREAQVDVWPVLTTNASRFVSPMTMAALAGRPAITNLWDAATAGRVGHIELAHRIQALVLAPATADLIARLCHGRADDPLTALALATTAPILVAPAMETGMWEHPATQANLATLQSRGNVIIPPESGPLASGHSGLGRLAATEVLLQHVLRATTPPTLAGEHVLVTAGPTQEPFDPVRFISNPSTGRMGYALAAAAFQAGAQVTLVSGPTQLEAPAGVTLRRVQTAEQMLDVCCSCASACSILLMAAAPADHRPAHQAPHKQKKRDGDAQFRPLLEPTPDILSTLTASHRFKVAVGFAAETQALIRHAQGKLEQKRLDLLVANDVTQPGAGFAESTNIAHLVRPDAPPQALPLMSKAALSQRIIQEVTHLLRR